MHSLVFALIVQVFPLLVNPQLFPGTWPTSFSSTLKYCWYEGQTLVREACFVCLGLE